MKLCMHVNLEDKLFPPFQVGSDYESRSFRIRFVCFGPSYSLTPKNRNSDIRPNVHVFELRNASIVKFQNLKAFANMKRHFPNLTMVAYISWILPSSPNPLNQGRATAQSVSRRLPIAGACVRTHVKSCGILNKVALGQIFSEYFSFSCQFSFHRLLHTHHHLSSGAGTIGQLVADVPSGLSLTPPQETNKKH
jgi:hypothetical protein